jgi:hypothetical protein
MTKRPALGRNLTLAAGLAGVILLLPACSEDEVQAVLAGIQVIADELEDSDDISFSDWIRSELDD